MNSAADANTALIIIDMQEGFHHPFWGKKSNPDLEKNVARLLSHWREMGRPIYHIQHLSLLPNSPLNPKSSGVAFMECAQPVRDEEVIQKSVNSAFIGTDLELRLRRKEIKNLVLVGISTDHCVSTSVRMASNLGFSCRMVSDATNAFDRTDHQGKTFPGELVHAVSLASLHGEFATVVDTDSLIANCEPKKASFRLEL